MKPEEKPNLNSNQSSNKKFLIGLVLFFVLGFGGLIFWQLKINEKNSIPLPTNQVLGLSVNPTNYDLGEISYSGGLVTKEYEITNTTNKPLRLKKITTSCMCTKAKVKVGSKETQFFGMEGHGNINSVLDSFEIAPNQKGIVSVQFDPTAHGPQGAGAVQRSVYLTFSDPVGMKELTFSGVVVLK